MHPIVHSNRCVSDFLDSSTPASGLQFVLRLLSCVNIMPLTRTNKFCCGTFIYSRRTGHVTEPAQSVGVDGEGRMDSVWLATSKALLLG